ncbi:MAG: MBL fold metallo-hydrolase [Bacteriovoracaceae bacterium]|jgi:glyoxylase-like metal-dependent hydrolase (beta-lactamase superfamily II)/8-oxo-dGTP pyrophosphatase MutT (NUDIX family)|nr:hypothetical protein [Halobacteriovoraceae bacterium]MDP7319900.1 MBL fold metallo-hydrolase [Bacteriovoracaceae bacterium]
MKKAVSLILRYNDKIFYIVRQNYLKAFPGYTAFPGGKVDQQDSVSDFRNTLLNTLKREAKEELGVDLQVLLGENFSNQCRMIAKASSPAFNPLQFETYFFLVDLDSIPHFVVDETEAMEFGWKEPEEILYEYESGMRLMIEPIKKILGRLNQKNESYFDFDSRPLDKVPYISPLGGLKQVMPKSNTVPPAQRTNSFLFGDSAMTLVDPSPKNTDELEAYLDAIKGFKIKNIMITHHHFDHHQFSPLIAQTLKVNILISEDSFKRIRKKAGEDYFGSVEINFLHEEKVINYWQGEEVKAYAIPGHDEGHFGLAPQSLRWFIVGDLFQGIGTVVVGGEEGDMTKYLDSLKKVIQMNPDCVIPSHGIAMGGVNILQKTLDHRLLREQQVKELSEKGKSLDEILHVLYFNLPQNLHRYARANIKAHLERLKRSNQ